MTNSVGVNVAIVKNYQVLLIQREDFEVWCLPGGNSEAGESLAETAIREVREETGLEISLQRLVGVYSEPRWFYRGLHGAAFTAQVIWGNLKFQLEEVVDVRFFRIDELPEEMIFGNKQQIFDAINGIGGSAVRTQRLPWHSTAHFSRQEIYSMRDSSGMKLSEFYMHHFQRNGKGEDSLDVQQIRCNY